MKVLTLFMLLTAFGKAAAVGRTNVDTDLVLSAESTTQLNVDTESRSTSRGRVVIETLERMYGSKDSTRPVGGGDCLGLKKKMCKPCPAPEKNDCKKVEAECDNLFCSPMCLQLAWNCTVVVDKAAAAKTFGDALTEAEKKAICAQMIGKACSDEFKCCKKDDAMTDWVESNTFGDFYPYPLLPVAPCLHDPSDKKAADAACKKCKASISVALTATPEKCSMGAGTMPSGLGVTGGKSKKPGAKTDGGGAMKSFEERCVALSKKINGKISGFMSKSKEYVCKCAGCCDPPESKPDDTCYFPVTRRI